MSSILISIISIIFGIIATIIVSSYYYKKSFKKSLTPYTQFFSTPLHGIDQEVRKDLIIKYKDKEIQELFEIQFLIANTGDKAIRDIIKPLTLTIPGKCNLLDATILHISPSGRNISLEYFEESNKISFCMQLLNSNEFFIVKLLLDKECEAKEFIFSIVADELPPILEGRTLTYDDIKSSEAENNIDFGLIGVSGLFIIFGLTIGYVVSISFVTLPSIKELGLSFFYIIGLRGWAIILSYSAPVFILIVGIMFLFLAFTDLKFPFSKKMFIVPNDKQLLKSRLSSSVFDEYSQIKKD